MSLFSNMNTKKPTKRNSQWGQNVKSNPKDKFDFDFTGKKEEK